MDQNQNQKCTSESEQIKTAIKADVNEFCDRISNTYDAIQGISFQELLDIDRSILIEKINAQLEQFKSSIIQEINAANENKNEELKKAECILKMQALWASISQHLSVMNNGNADGTEI